MSGGRSLFCFGLGYSAQVLARRFVARGEAVAGTMRTQEGAEALRAMGITPHLYGSAAVDGALAKASHILVSVPPDEARDPVLLRYGAALVAQAPRLRWIGYLSTTGVYGDRGGGWVDEESALAPTGPRGARRVAAEAAWQDLAAKHGLPLHIFRLAAIYGPGRNALRALLEGTAQRIDKPGQVFSRIHVEDLANALEASTARPQAGRIYNLCDDAPAPPAEIIAFAAELLGLSPPPLIPWEEAALSPMAASFYDDNKRVSNARAKRELALTLRYPSYREGLRALLAVERPPNGQSASA
jgi:nucleoside-diphosphate-sugar epimerase